MSTLRATNLKGGSAGSAPNFPDGAVITGVATVGVLSATTFYGSGANLTGIDATSIKHTDGSVRIQANASGALVTGVITAPSGKFGALPALPPFKLVTLKVDIYRSPILSTSITKVLPVPTVTPIPLVIVMLGTTETTYEVDKPELVPSKLRSDVTAVYLSI